MLKSSFDDIQEIEDNCFHHACECGCELYSIDSDWFHFEDEEVPLELKNKGIGWMRGYWRCEECGVVSSLSLGVVSNPKDDVICIDNFQQAKTSQIVLLKKDGMHILGVEEFCVKHENPAADFKLREYDCMCEYTIGPFKEERSLKEAALKLAPLLIQRAQVELPIQQALKSAN